MSGKGVTSHSRWVTTNFGRQKDTWNASTRETEKFAMQKIITVRRGRALCTETGVAVNDKIILVRGV